VKRGLPAYCYFKGKNKLVYFCKRGQKPIRIRSEPGTAEFAAEYALLMRGREIAPARTVAKLIAHYKASPRWDRLAANTRKSYAGHMAYFLEVMPDVDPATIRRVHVIEMRDAHRDTPTTANRRVAVLSALFEHAIDLGWLPQDHNPAKGVEQLAPPRPPREPWPADMIAAFRAQAPALPRLIFELCLGTGQRVGDVLKMRWDQIEAGGIYVRQTKTSKGLWVPFTRYLATVLERLPRLGQTIVAQPNGKPVSYSMAARDIQRVREQIGAMAWDIHALRHSAASEIASLPGMTMEHVKAITGHSSDDMARLYAGKAAQKARAKEAQSGRE